MNEKLESEFRQLYGSLVDVAEETIEKLGEDKARRFFRLSTDWVDIQNDGLFDAYSSGELNASLVYLDFVGLFKELRWLQLFLFCGNYPIIYRNLRFDWELMFRSFYADMYQHLFPDRQDGPSPSADDKAAWLEDREKTLDWNEVMQPVLKFVLPQSQHAEIENRYKPLWQKLHKYVHASTQIRYRMIDESNLLVVDNYDDAWARESVQDGTEVFDVIWLAVLNRFPACVPFLKNSLTCKYCTKTRGFLREINPQDGSAT